MKRKNNWNLFGVIALIAICAFMLISCPQNLATERPKLYKTLTLEIDGQKQNLYYGEDGAWYSALSDDGLLLDENKVAGNDVKFNIPSAPTWIVTFKRNTPAGAIDSEISISHESVEVHPELSLSPDNVIDKATGKVVASSISENITVTGTYPPTAIGASVTALSTNANYEFEKWTANGDDVTDITTYEIYGNIEIVANWKNVSDFKVLTVKTGDKREDTAYYNIADGKWYISNITTSGEKTSVATLADRTYTITLNYDNGSSNGSGTAISSFRGYGDGSEVKVQANGSLSGYTINSDTTLFAKWSEAKFNKPSDPTKDGYNFDAW